MSMRALSGPLMVLVTCVVASLCYVGAVTFVALTTMVLPLVVLAGLVAWRLSERPINAVVGTLVVAGAGGEVVNVVSGHYQGSVARSAGVAALLTGIAVCLAYTRRPALFLAPLVGIVAWALALGAGARVELIAVCTAMAAAVALATVERDARSFMRPPGLGVGVALALLLVMGAAVSAAAFQRQFDSRQAASPFRDTLAKTIDPPAFLSLTRTPPASATRPTPPVVQPPTTRREEHAAGHVAERISAVVAVLVALIVLTAMARVLWVALAWRILRRRLGRQSMPEAAAWVWTMAVLDRLAEPVPADMSPDRVLEDPALVSLHRLAETVVPATFSLRSADEKSNAWAAAAAATSVVRQEAGGLRRMRALWRPPRRAGASPRVASMLARGAS